MFNALQKMQTRPEPFEFYTTDVLWTDEHIARQMLAYHLNEQVDAASRNPKFIDRSVAWMVDTFHIRKGFSLIDFGCGPGLYTQRLARSGASVMGVDFSGNSLAYARSQAQREGLSIQYVQENYLNFVSNEQVDFVSMIMCDFCALSPVQRRQMLQRFAACLKPGGKILLDAYTLKAYQKREEKTLYEFNLMDGFWSAEPYHGFLHVFKYDQAVVVLDQYTIIESESTRMVYNWLQYFSREQIALEFEQAGLRIHAWLGDVAGADYDDQADEFAVIAEKIN
jgi:2-polyprenyl-3-methyl-5-hydroxy-6-metoxy-1,4-benzoquinol methylase